MKLSLGDIFINLKIELRYVHFCLQHGCLPEKTDYLVEIILVPVTNCVLMRNCRYVIHRLMSGWLY